MPTEESQRIEIHLPSEKCGEFALHGKEAQADMGVGLELNEDVQVAVGAEVIPEDGTEDLQPADVVPATEIGDGPIWEIHSVHIHSSPPPPGHAT